MTRNRRSSLGGHWAGTGIAGPTSKEFDDFTKKRGNKSFRPIRFSTDEFKDKKEFEKYCKEQSGEVITYNINDNTQMKE